VSAYKEDFAKERADRERLSSEKNAMKLKHDNEMATLRIRLDKLQKELNHYTSCNVKLEQQLKLRSSKDSDAYQSYLSTKVCVLFVESLECCYVCTVHTFTQHMYTLCSVCVFVVMSSPSSSHLTYIAIHTMLIILCIHNDYTHTLDHRLERETVNKARPYEVYSMEPVGLKTNNILNASLLTCHGNILLYLHLVLHLMSLK